MVFVAMSVVVLWCTLFTDLVWVTMWINFVVLCCALHFLFITVKSQQISTDTAIRQEWTLPHRRFRRVRGRLYDRSEARAKQGGHTSASRGAAATTKFQDDNIRGRSQWPMIIMQWDYSVTRVKTKRMVFVAMPVVVFWCTLFTDLVWLTMWINF